jgi:hypothetical protein
MNPTSQNPGHKFPFSSGHNAMDNRTLYGTLAVSVGVAFVFTLLLHASLGGNPPSWLGFGFLVSIVPALGVLAVIKLTRLLLSRLGAVFIYAVLFVVVLLLQAVGRLIPVNS